MLNFLLYLSISNKFSYDFANTEYTLQMNYDGKRIHQGIKTFWKISGQSDRVLSPSARGSDFYQGIILDTNIILPENEDKIILDYTLQNNGTTAKKIDLYFRTGLYFGNEGKLQIEPFGDYQGYHYSNPNTNEEMYLISRGGEYANAYSNYHSQYYEYNFYTNMDPRRYIQFTNLLIYWKDKLIDVDEVVHLYVTFTPNLQIKQSPNVIMNTPIEDTYPVKHNLLLEGRCEGYENGQTIALYYQYNWGQVVKLNEFNVSEELRTIDFSFELILESYRTSRIINVWAVTKDAIITNYFSKFLCTGRKPVLYIITPPKQLYYKDSTIYVDFVGNSDMYAYLYYNVDNKYYSSFKYINDGFRNLTYLGYFQRWDIYEGKHNITLYIKDDYHYSESFYYEFDVITKPRPSLSLLNGFQGNSRYYNYYQNISIPISMKGGTVGENITHYWTIANDDGVNSDIPYTSSYVRKDLRIHFTTPIQQYYSPSSIINLEGFAYNFDPGHMIDLKYTINYGQYISLNHNEIVMDDNYISNNFIFNITMPEIPGSYRYNFYSYDKNSTQTGYSYEIIFKVSIPGSINEVSNLEDTYSINAFIEVTFTGYQYNRGYLYFQYDNGPINKLDEIINFNRQNVTITKQVPTKDYKLSIGEHNVTFYLYDEYGCPSENNYTHVFNSDDRNVPYLDLYYYSYGNPMRYSDPFSIKFRYGDKDKNQKVNITVHWDDQEPYSVFEYTSNGYERYYVTRTFSPPKIDGIHTITSRSYDESGAKSKKHVRAINVKRQPYLYFTLPDRLYIVGETATLTGYVLDLIPGEEIQLVLKFDNYLLIEDIPNITMDETYRKDFTINITIPNFNKHTFMSMYAKCQNYTTNTEWHYRYITQRPYIYDYNPFDPQYSMGEIIIFEGIVWDEDYVNLYYKFDEMHDYEYINQRIDCQGSNKSIRIQIPTSNKIYSVGEKTLQIHVRDRFRAWSNTITHKFILESLRAPEIEVIRANQNKQIYYFHESVKLILRMRDRNYGDEVQIFMKVNSGDFTNIINYTSHGTYEDIPYDFEYEHINGKYDLVFKAIDNTDSASPEVSISFEVKQTPITVVTNILEGMYEPGTKVNITCFAGDFNPGSTIQFYYRINSENTVYLHDVFEISEDFRTPEYTFTIKLPESAKRNTIYVYSKDENNRESQYAILYTTTNYNPKIIRINDLKPEYASNEYIDIDGIIFDDSRVKLYYQYDKRAVQYLSDWIDCTGADLQIHKQIPVPKESFRGGEHKITIYLIDQYDIKSNEVSFRFIYNDRHAPELGVKLLSGSKTYSFYDIIKFNCSVIDPDVGNTISLRLKINNSDEQTIYDYTSDGEISHYLYDFAVPNVNGVVNFVFRAEDNFGSFSNEQSFDIKVKQTPSVIITSGISSYYNGGEEVEISGFVVDYDPGQEVQVLYSISGGNSVFATPLMIMNDNYVTNQFEFVISLPTKVGTHSVTFWAENSNGIKSEYSRQFFTVNVNPKIITWNEIRPTYAKNGFIDFDSVIFDDSTSMIHYYFDTMSINSINEWINAGGKNLSIRRQIPIPNDLSIGSHTITVYLRDWYGAESEKVTKNFRFTNSYVPTLKVSLSENRNTYGFHESVTFNGSVHDLDAQDKTYVFVEIDNDEETQVAEFDSNNEVHNFTYTIQLPHVDGDHTVIFKARDESGSSSGDQKFTISVKQSPSVIITSELSPMYLPNETISISGYIVDFNVGDEVQLYFRVNNDITEYATLPMIVGENFKTDIFTFNTTLPIEVRRNQIIIWASSNSSMTSRTSYINIITNRAPVLDMWKPIKGNYSMSEYIDIDCNITDDLNCRIYYSFDDKKAKYIDEMLPIRSPMFPVIKRVPIDGNDLAFGTHTMKVWIVDEFGVKSNEISQDFEFRNMHAPEIVLNPLPKRGPYNYHEKVTFSGSVRDLDSGDHVIVIFKVGSSEPTELYDSISDGQWHDFSYTINVPRGDAEYTIFVAAMDQTLSKSNEATLSFKAQRAPAVKMLNEMRQAYGASETMVLSSMLMDFNENSTISFCYSIDGEDKNFISYVEIYDNMTSGIVNYNITLPNSKNDHYLILWGENELGHVLCPYNEIYIIVSQAPELNITNTLLGTYYSHAFIEVDVSVYDDTEGYVYCKIDDGKEFKISKLIQSFYEIEERVLQVEIKEGTLSEGSHSLSIFMRDEFGSDSVAVVHNFEYSLSKQTPELSVESKVKGYTYGYFESIKIKCKAKSFNEGDKISLKIKLNYDEYFTIHEFSSDSTRYILSNDDESSDGILVYDYDLKIPPSDGFYTASIKAVNQDGIESKITFVDFEVRRLPGIEFTQPFRVNYNSDETIVVSGHVVDYEIGQDIDIFYNVDNGNKIFVDRVKIDGEYKSKEFSFTINPSSDVNIHSSKVWLEINNKVIYQTNGNFLVNSPPQISLLNSTQLRNVYYDGDHINLDYKIKDNTQAVVCYKFDSRPETCFKDTVYSYEREYNYRKQILVDQTVLSHDEHTITIYARDEFKMESEIITHRFTLSEGGSPDITIDGFARQYEYNFYESIYIKGSVIDTSPTEGGKVTVYCRFNFSDPIPLHEFESDGHSHNFESYVPVPRNNSKYFIVVYAVDNMGSYSRDFRHDFKVQHKPCIKLHNSIEHSYMPGDNVTIEGFAGDFTPGMSLNIFYQLKGKTPERIGTFEVNPNLTTNVFSFTIQVPDEVTPQSLKIWAEDRGQVVATLDKGYGVINLRPMLKITNKVNQRYYNRGFIDIEFRVWDNTRVRLWYCIDGVREINITDYIECNGEWKEDFAQIELPAGFYEFGSHKLYIFVRDEFGAESADTPYDFLLIDQNAPDMEILSVETKEEYEYNDIVLLQGRVRDIDPGDKISVSLQLNRQGYKEIFSTISTGDWQYFNYSFSVPKNDGLHIVTFQARDNMSAASRASRYKIKVRRPRGISMRKQLPSYAEPLLPIEIGGYVVPSTFKPEITKVRVMGRFGNSGTRFYIDVFTIHNSMSATDFNFNFTVPRDAKSGIVEIIFVDDNNETDVLENFTQNIIINERPELKILKDIGERFPAHAFIDIDSEIRDDTKANIRYKIDDGEEMNASDFIECLGNDKRVRTQIEIKPGSLTFRKHTITIYAVDEYGLTSNSTTYSFYYYNSNTPELTVTNIEEISDHTFKITDKITISGIVDDADIEDNLRVRMRFDYEEFEIIHSCSSSDRDQCKKFNYTFNVPRSTGNHDIILQALDDRDFVSKDVKINFKVEKHFVSPARTPASFPVFPKIPTGYTGRTTYTTAITAVETFITDINGDIFVTYTDIITTYEITVIDPTTEQVEIGFLQTTFGKYILWPIIACIVIIAVVIIIVLVKLKKNQNDESSTDLAGNNEEQFEMEQETIIISKTEESMVTTDNPLFTTQNSAAADDPFHEDFEDKGGLFSDSDNDVVDANIDQSDSDIVDDG